MDDHGGNGLLDLLEGNLVVVCFQMQIKKLLEQIASRVETLGTRNTFLINNPSLVRNIVVEDTLAQSSREKHT